MAAALVETDWSYCFYVLGGFIIVFGILNFLFLAVSPEDVDCSPPKQNDKVNISPHLMDEEWRDPFTMVLVMSVKVWDPMFVFFSDFQIPVNLAVLDFSYICSYMRPSSESNQKL